jgi:hypothetical protein
MALGSRLVVGRRFFNPDRFPNGAPPIWLQTTTYFIGW